MTDGLVRRAHLPSEWLRQYVLGRGGVLDIAVHTLVSG
jgi:hypothetical protein